MARQTAHVASVMLSTRPFEVSSIAPVTGQARFVYLRRSTDGWRIRRLSHLSSRAGLSMLFTIAMAALAPGRTCVFQELGAFTVSIKCKGLHDEPVALKTVFSYNFNLSRSYA
ncbi:MAG TPA: hypothetical protein VKA78_15950 [Pyrinomonadaceae bacterium]|nr:hypothetical protein [Pyrinomonadaceae bacterium]